MTQALLIVCVMVTVLVALFTLRRVTEGPSMGPIEIVRQINVTAGSLLVVWGGYFVVAALIHALGGN